MALRETTRTTTLPVSLADLKIHLRIDTTHEDALLLGYERAAIFRGENLTRRAWQKTEWELTLDSFPTGQLVLPRPPLTTISTEIVVGYIDESGTTQTLGATGFGIDNRTEPGSIVPSTEANDDWPETNDVINAVTINYFSGYSTVAGSIPPPIDQWIKIQVGQMYEFREPVVEASLNTQRRDWVDGLLDLYIIPTPI